ncbi:hypothetical protein BT63DRAFT_410727 [Microthyrium microscopicum]|uniref:DUF6590 domain-containing protein n=1 Tax=Microthyrium microscopicum TaxID=703497 RepID=A0A6A6UQQ0_9PEZI|nr:hypothetical protein BT63DRAFT_410727 [Microthyrium microscopicum]
MSDFPGKWEYDKARQSYYYYSRRENAYIYQDKTRIPINATAAAAVTIPTLHPATPRSEAQKTLDRNVVKQATKVDDDDDEEDDDEDEEDDDEDEDDDDEEDTTPQGQSSRSTLEQKFSGMKINQNFPQQHSQYQSPNVSSYTTAHSYGGQQQQHPYGGQQQQQQHPSYTYGTQTGYAAPRGYVGQQVPAMHAGMGIAGSHRPTVGGFPNEINLGKDPARDTDPFLLQFGLPARGRIRGAASPKPQPQLDPGYKVRKPGHKFFKTGKVFKILWPEIAGQANNSVTITSDNRFVNESIASHIRWFVVVREGKGYCSCLPINTYNRKGVAKTGVLKWQHAIAFSQKDEPRPFPDEMPTEQGERPMMPGIRVVPKSRTEKLDSRARIDFGRIYTVEHNVKVYDFGNADEVFVARLLDQWVHVIQTDLDIIRRSYLSSMPDSNAASTLGYPATGGMTTGGGAGHTPTVQEEEEDEEDDEEEEDDDDDEDDEDDDDEEEEPTTTSRRSAAEKSRKSSTSKSRSSKTPSSSKTSKSDASKKKKKKRGFF